MGLPPTVAPAGLNLAGSQTQDLCGSGFVTELTAAEGGQRLGGAWKGVPKQLDGGSASCRSRRGSLQDGSKPGRSAVRGLQTREGRG